MNTIREITQINDEELSRGITGTSASWHSKYEASAWVFVGNLAHELTEGDVMCIMSQWGEVEDLNLVRDDDTGKSKGFGFLKYEDVASTVLAVDNFAGSRVLGRSIRVDHVEKYRLPKHILEKEEEEKKLREDGTYDIYGRGGESNKISEGGSDIGGAGHAYRGQELANGNTIDKGVDLFGGDAKLDAGGIDNRFGGASYELVGEEAIDFNIFDGSSKKRKREGGRKKDKKEKKEKKHKKHKKEMKEMKEKKHKKEKKSKKSK